MEMEAANPKAYNRRVLTGIEAARRWWRLPRGERRLALEAAVLAEIARLGLAVATVRTVQRALERVPRARRAATADAIERAADRAAASRPHVSCLPESLGRAAMLARHGHGARLRVGFRTEGRAIAGHAWIERGDRRDSSAMEWPTAAGAPRHRAPASARRGIEPSTARAGGATPRVDVDRVAGRA